MENPRASLLSDIFFVILGHSNILGTNLNAENGEILINSAESAHYETVQ